MRTDGMYDSYFEEYRRKMHDFETINDKMNEIRSKADRELAEFRAKREKIQHEINDMRRVITQMIDNGCDPVEARLKIDHERATNIWNLNDSSIISGDYITITGATGPNGVVGAIGAGYSSMGPLGSAGPDGYETYDSYSSSSSYDYSSNIKTNSW